jgi:anaerobic ribonucleoside-triphosphate reductase
MMDNRRIPCECWTRVVGYLRPTSAMSPAKQQEFADRVPFRVAEEERKEEAHD